MSLQEVSKSMGGRKPKQAFFKVVSAILHQRHIYFLLLLRTWMWLWIPWFHVLCPFSTQQLSLFSQSHKIYMAITLPKMHTLLSSLCISSLWITIARYWHNRTTAEAERHTFFFFFLFLYTESVDDLCTEKMNCCETVRPNRKAMTKSKGKGKTVPLQALSGPDGSRKLRFPDFMTTAQEGGKVVSLTHRPHLPPGNPPGTHFCYRLSRPQGHIAIGMIMSMKNSNDTIWDQISDLLICSTAP